MTYQEKAIIREALEELQAQGQKKSVWEKAMRELYKKRGGWMDNPTMDNMLIYCLAMPNSETRDNALAYYRKYYTNLGNGAAEVQISLALDNTSYNDKEGNGTMKGWKVHGKEFTGYDEAAEEATLELLGYVDDGYYLRYINKKYDLVTVGDKQYQPADVLKRCDPDEYEFQIFSFQESVFDEVKKQVESMEIGERKTFYGVEIVCYGAGE